MTDPAVPEHLEPDLVTGPGDAVAAPPDGEAAQNAVEEPAKVMRVGTMIRQLLDEVRQTPLDEPSRERLREIYETSIAEIGGALSPDLPRGAGPPGPALRSGGHAHRRRAAHRPGPARRLAGRAVPRDPGHALRPADGRPQPARGHAPPPPARPGPRRDRAPHRGHLPLILRCCWRRAVGLDRVGGGGITRV